MEEILSKALDFGIRVVELSNYLEDENRRFPLINRLLECGTGVGVLMRLSKDMPQDCPGNCMKALKLALEAEYLFELMVKTGIITEHQSRPIMYDCRTLKAQIGTLAGDKSDIQKCKEE